VHEPDLKFRRTKFEKFKPNGFKLGRSRVDSVAIYNRSLSAAEIQQHYTEGIQLISQRRTTFESRQLDDVIPEESFNDALHVAIATINKIDILASWNFSHLVNTNTRHKVNGINLLHNHSEIEIASPLELGGGNYV